MANIPKDNEQSLFEKDFFPLENKDQFDFGKDLFHKGGLDSDSVNILCFS
jgi:hypothetical protein